MLGGQVLTSSSAVSCARCGCRWREVSRRPSVRQTDAGDLEPILKEWWASATCPSPTVPFGQGPLRGTPEKSCARILASPAHTLHRRAEAGCPSDSSPGRADGLS